MIVIARSYGQLGNRLFLFAHLMAAARHHGVSLANPCFAEYAHLFPATANDLWCRYPQVPVTKTPPSLRRRQWLAKSVYLATRGLDHLRLRQYPYQVIRLKRDQACDLASESFAERAKHRRPLLAQGWLFRSEPLLQQHAGAIRDHFQIGADNRRRVDQVMAEIRQQADYVVGVHIRHGDYATYLDGKYFYSIEQYADIMRTIEAQMPHRKVAFLVCSNVPLHRGDFGNLNVHFGPGAVIEDLYSFAETDLLIGPPSTFTGWAAFYGDVPLIPLESADMQIDLPAVTAKRAA